MNIRSCHGGIPDLASARTPWTTRISAQMIKDRIPRMISALAASLTPRAAKTQLSHSVEWTRADITVNDTDAAQRERPKMSARISLRISVAVGNGSFRQSAGHMTWL